MSSHFPRHIPLNVSRHFRREYDKGNFSCDHEMRPIDFLDKIHRSEVLALHDFLYGPLRETYFRFSGYALLGVGSITYDDAYWDDLAAYFREHDPTKLPYAERRGEDVDFVLLPDIPINPSHQPFMIDEWLIPSLDKAKISYTLETDGAESGTTYFTVPEEYREAEGEGVLRHKRIDYSLPRLCIHTPGDARDLHIILNHTHVDLHLKEERLRHLDRSYSGHTTLPPFSVLFRSHSRYLFENLLTTYLWGDVQNLNEPTSMLLGAGLPEYSDEDIP